MIAPLKRQVYTGAPCGGQKDLSLNIHSQQSMDYTHRAAKGDVASAAIPVSISATYNPTNSSDRTTKWQEQDNCNRMGLPAPWRAVSAAPASVDRALSFQAAIGKGMAAASILKLLRTLPLRLLGKSAEL